MVADQDLGAAQSLSDLLDAEVVFLCVGMKVRREVAPLFANGSSTEFKSDLKRFILHGLGMGKCTMDFSQDGHSQTCGTASRPWRFAPEDRDELMVMIINAFQMPVSLGDDVFSAATGHLHRNLQVAEHGLDVFQRLRDSLDGMQVKQQSEVKTQKTAEAVKKSAHKAKGEGMKKATKKPQDASPESKHTKKAQRTEESGAHHGDSEAQNEQIPKGPDALQIITMAARLCPAMDVESVRDVQKMISTDLREILMHAKGAGYEDVKLDKKTIQSIHFMWMLFCHEQGSCREAEAIVCNRLRKAEPALGLLLYGPNPIAELSDSGFRVKKGSAGYDARGQTKGVDDYQALCETLERLKNKPTDDDENAEGQHAGGQCGVTGLLKAVFGECDYPALVTELLVDLSPSARDKLITSLAYKLKSEEESRLPQKPLEDA